MGLLLGHEPDITKLQSQFLENTGMHINMGLLTNLILVPMVTPPCGEGRILL